jgi:hypothetical protein
MSANPQQRREITLEKLNTLRDKVRQAFFVSKGEILQTPKNKNNVYYFYLRKDISLRTDKEISEGTLLKFFHEDSNRIYQIIIISTIEVYVDQLLVRNTAEKDLSNPNEEEIKVFAKRVYIELTTRKAGIPIDEEKDVIEEIYNSWYKLFCLIRDEMKMLPVGCFKNIENPESITGLTSKILNDVLRQHLTEHQARFRSWLGKTKETLKNKTIAPQELQKKYPDYKILMKSLKDTNEMLIDSAEKLCVMIK